MELAEFIKTHVDEINDNNFTKVYEDAYELLANYEIGQFTDILIAAKINPLLYMSRIPNNYMSGSKQKSLEIPNNITTISWWAFYNAKSLTEIEIPDNVSSMNGPVFMGCDKLRHVALSNSIKTLGPSLFSGCSELTNIEIPKNVTNIKRETFSDCAKLPNITIPESVKSIGDFAFSGCHSLTDVMLPNSLVEIGNGAFYDCVSLVNIHFDGTKEQWRTIKKGNEWNKLTSSYTVHCINDTLHKGGR